MWMGLMIRLIAIVSAHNIPPPINPLGAMCIYICMRAPTAHRDEHIYICTQYKQVPTALSCQAKQDCGVNPYLMSSNKSRPHLSTYITARKGQEGAVLMCE